MADLCARAGVDCLGELTQVGGARKLCSLGLVLVDEDGVEGNDCGMR